MNEEMFEKIAEEAYANEMDKIALVGFGGKEATKGRMYAERLAGYMAKEKRKDSSLSDSAAMKLALRKYNEACDGVPKGAGRRR